MTLEALAASGPQFWQFLINFSLHPGPYSDLGLLWEPFLGSGFGPFPSSIRWVLCSSS